MSRIKSRPRGRTPLLILAAALAGATVPATGAGAGLAAAGTVPFCVTAGATVTCDFTYNGDDPTDGTAYSWAVPAGVTSLTVIADGAAGSGGAPGGPGCAIQTCAGAGGEYQATLSGIPAGTTLSVFPGGSGSTFGGGANGGGSGASGGGGASTVSLTPVDLPSSLLVVAGGGGGSGRTPLLGLPASGGSGGTSTSPGGGNGLSASGPLFLPDYGQGGTAGVGGPGGVGNLLGSGCPAGSPGDSLQGGAGAPFAPSCSAGAGGGGGYFGGGGSSSPAPLSYGGGGGGSAYPAAATTVGDILVTPVADSSIRTGNGEILISYTAAAPTTTTMDSVTPHAHPDYFGSPVTLKATVSGSDGGGMVEFDADGAAIPGCTAVALAPAGGTDYTATCTTTSVPGGHDAITAVYSGDAASQGSASGPLTAVVLPALTGLKAGHHDGPQGVSVTGTLTAFFRPVVGEEVDFSHGHTFLCRAVTGGNGTASCTLTRTQTLAVGLNGGHFTASYDGSGDYTRASANGVISP